MNLNTIQTIINETAYVHMGGTPEELKCAEYLQKKCQELGFDTVLEPFTVPMAAIRTATLTVDGKEISNG